MKIATVTYKSAPEIEVQDKIVIENYTDLQEHFEKVKSARIEGAFEMYLNGESEKQLGKSFENYHPAKHNTLSTAVNIFHKHSGLNLIGSATTLQMKIFQGMARMLDLGYTLLVNQAGGYCNLDYANVNILELKEVDYAPVEFLTTKII